MSKTMRVDANELRPGIFARFEFPTQISHVKIPILPIPDVSLLRQNLRFITNKETFLITSVIDDFIYVLMTGCGQGWVLLDGFILSTLKILFEEENCSV